ncbi:acyl-CoA thioesterase [Pseudomonas aegrilactucae]|uniref:Thioesterase family protein n=1 Tax=Pseudomonas aegrilactucae TaxID=2854028 RepID=A0A9Q3ACZ5_9PSED|nr:thioesterase family protein [Pseudomonas aegrilactucae]MBV6288122.1 thioesterase family protein [Pseudomonas aegrilactucae]
MNFSQLLTAVRLQPQAVVIPAEWAQGRACFGGLMAALLYEAMHAKVAPDRPVRSLAITFVGPAEPGMPISFEVEPLRDGKAVSSLLGRAVQNGQVVTLIQGSFGAGRSSVVEVAALPAVALKPLAEATPEMPYIKGITPEFIRHLALRWGIGGLPYSNTQARSMGGWVRLRGEDVVEELVTEAHLLALVDAWPPALLPHLSTPAPGSTLTWTIEFVQPVASLTTLDWCQYCAQIDYARDGYGHVSAALWTAAGDLLAISRQTVTVFG